MEAYAKILDLAVLDLTNRDWRQCIIPPESPIEMAMRVLEQSGLGLVLVTGKDSRLLGLLTDGDIRRAILSRTNLDEAVSKIINRKPIVGLVGEAKLTLRARMWRNSIRHIPIIDSSYRVVGLEVADLGAFQAPARNRVAVVMAGGLGMRLRPLTDACPKPLLEVEGKPILEHTVSKLADQGFSKVILSVNYRGEMVEKHFGDGSDWGIEIEYIKEPKRLGTAGALALMPSVPDGPFIVMNGDLMTDANLQNLLDYHHENRAKVTVAVTELRYEVPYGVVQVDNYCLTHFEEKPEQHFFVNAGIYVLGTEALRKIPRGEYFDMTDVIQSFTKGAGVSVFPIHEYWIDIGDMKSYEQAQVDRRKNFLRDKY